MDSTKKESQQKTERKEEEDSSVYGVGRGKRPVDMLYLWDEIILLGRNGNGKGQKKKEV